MDTDLYREAAEILTRAAGKRASLKTLIYSSNYKNIRKLFALVNECMKYREILEEVTSHCSRAFMAEEFVGGSMQMAVALLYEYLLGHKFGKDVSLRRMFHRYKTEVKTAVEKVLATHEAKTLQEAAQNINRGATMQIPRYMRVNLIKSSVQAAVEELKSEGWNYVGIINKDTFSEAVQSFNESQFGLDPMLPDLLVFPIGTDLHDHCLTKSGVLIQQDRASCVPAHVLNPATGSVVLDCCAAPGNKTSHLASLMRDKGRVIALDRDYKRMLTMSRLLEKSGATCVELIHQDFLTVQPGSEDAQDINFILVDPSCSGSGMLGSQMDKSGPEKDNQRLQTLRRFQISILKHALRFPNVERVVYSTCSVHPEENEQVVEEVMAQVSEYFQFHPVYPKWKKSHGLDGFPHSEFFLRLAPQKDLTQGFFVACFERVKHKPQTLVDNRETQSENGERLDHHEHARDILKSDLKDKKNALQQQIRETQNTEIAVVSETTARKRKKTKQGPSCENDVISLTEATEKVTDKGVSVKPQKSRKTKHRSADWDVCNDDSVYAEDAGLCGQTEGSMKNSMERADKADTDRASVSKSKKRRHKQSSLSPDDTCASELSRGKKKDKNSALGQNESCPLEGGVAKKRKKNRQSSLSELEIRVPDGREVASASPQPLKNCKRRLKDKSSDRLKEHESAYTGRTNVVYSDLDTMDAHGGKMSKMKKEKKKKMMRSDD